ATADRGCRGRGCRSSAHEGTFPRRDPVLDPARLEDPFERRFGAVPQLCFTEELGRTGRELDVPAEPERGERLLDPGEERPDLGLDLFLGHEDVSVVLDELADAGEPVEGPARFVSMERSELR